MICLLKNKDHKITSEKLSLGAQTIALQCLTFLISHEEARTMFLSTSGLNIEDIKNKAEQPDFLAGVMDFFLSDEEMVQAFCIEYTLTAQDLWRARRALPAPPIEGP